jgi:hypothetical protein
MYNFNNAILLLTQALMERGPSFVYTPRDNSTSGNSCLYFYEGKPDCIVGLVGSYVGITSEDVHEGYGDPISQEAFIKKFDDNALSLLATVQKYQDSGYNWGDAVKEGIAKMSPLVKENSHASYSVN